MSVSVALYSRNALFPSVRLFTTGLRGEVYHRTFFHKHPVKQRIQQGEIVAAKTLDSSGKD